MVNDIDFVVTYVNCEDKKWQQLYEETSIKKHKKIKKNSVRYRDFGTLKYQFRCIANNLPWIRKLYLIVQSESQIPEWVNRDTVHVVYHDQIIDYHHLPTYNSDVIEVYMHRIPGLSEYFLYANDDMFPINPSQPEDWYDENGYSKIVIKTWKYSWNDKIYRQILKSTENLCRKLCELPRVSDRVMHSDHSINPMRKSIWQYVWAKQYDKMYDSCSTFREAKNISQEVNNFYSYLSNEYSLHERNNKYLELNASDEVIQNAILGDEYTCICLNDNGCDNFIKTKQLLIDTFEKKYPEKCKYEL